jgi:hypothetical protein
MGVFNIMEMLLPQMIISMLLFIVLFFGIGFLLNMLLRATWFMAILYPLVVIMIVDDVRFFEYFTEPATSFAMLGQDLIGLSFADITILTCGFIGALLAGVAIKMLRVRGYQMF